MLDVRFVCICVLAYAVFSLFLSFYILRRLTLTLETVIIRFLRSGRVPGCILPGMYICMISILRKMFCLPSPGRTREILEKKKTEATGVDSCGLSNHSFRSGGATAACKSECSKFMADRSLTRLRMDMFVVKPALCADKYLRNS